MTDTAPSITLPKAWRSHDLVQDRLAWTVRTAYESQSWALDSLFCSLDEQSADKADDELNCLSDSLDELRQSARMVTHYSDGRPIHSYVQFDTGTTYQHTWHWNPEQAESIQYTRPLSHDPGTPERGEYTVHIDPANTRLSVVVCEIGEPEVTHTASQVSYDETMGHESVGVRPNLEQLKQALANLEAAQDRQLQDLLEARVMAAEAQERAQVEEPWSTFVKSLPSYDSEGVPTGREMKLPTMLGKEMFGGRLAYELVGCVEDDDAAHEVLSKYLAMVGEPELGMLVFSSALAILSGQIVPMLLDALENNASDYTTRVALARSAATAWSMRSGDVPPEVNPDRTSNDDD